MEKSWPTAAIEPHRTGRIQNAMNASIFPVTELVIAGFTTIVSIRRAAITSSAYSNISGDGKFNALLQNSLSLDLHRLL